MEGVKEMFPKSYGYVEQIEEGELVTGFQARHRFARNERAVGWYNWLIPTGLRSFSESLQDFVGNVEELLDGHTLYPLFSRFLNEADRETIKRHFLEDAVPSAASKIGIAGPLRDWNKDLLAWCSECMKSDMTHGKKPFWRRDHFVPGVLFCGTHGGPLEVHCVSCDTRRRKFIAPPHPGRTCECEQRFMNDGLSLSPEQVENEVEIARATSLLLDSKYLPGLNYERICSAIRDAAVSKGVMQGKLVDWSVFMELVSDERIIGSATRTNFLNLDRRIIVQAIRGEGTLRHPIHNIILLQMLIGRWSDVELAFKGESIEIEISRDDEKLGSQRVTRRRNMSYERREELIEKFRPMYLQLRADYPTLSHTQVLSMLPAMGQKAIRAKHANEESDNRRERHFANLDSEVVLHVCENLRGLRISGRVQKITVRVLLHGHRLLDTIGRVRPHLPKADALLNTLVGLRLAVEEVKE